MEKQNMRRPLAGCAALLLLLVSCAGQGQTETDTAGETDATRTTETESAAKAVTAEESTQTAPPETDIPETDAETAPPEPQAETVPEPKPIRRTDDFRDPGGNAEHIRPEDLKEGVVCQDVTIGKEINGEPWMFYYDSMEDYRGDNLYSDKMLRHIGIQMQKRSDWCKENGMTFYFMIAPNKNTIYPEYMPEDIPMGDYRRIDQIYDYLRENTTVRLIDVRPALFEAKEAHPDELLYYPYDTHWNNHGSYFAYAAAMEEIGKDFPHAVCHSRDAYQIDYFDSYFKDQAYYLGLYDTLTSEGPVYTKRDGRTGTVVNHDNRDGSAAWGQFAHAYIDPETGFQDAVHFARYENTFLPDAPSLFVARDSFFIGPAPFFADSFSEMTSIWTTGFPNQKIEKKHPDIVLFECVESTMDVCFGAKVFADPR